MSDRRLRVSHVVIQPVLVWDDGEELSPGPELQGFSVPLSRVPGIIDSLPGEVELLATKIAEGSDQLGA